MEEHNSDYESERASEHESSKTNEELEDDIKGQVEEVLNKFMRNLPLRLLDTYTGHLLKQADVIKVLKARKDYNEMLKAIMQEARQPSPPEGSEEPPLLFSKIDNLERFITEYLAYAMFSHRWRRREPLLHDVTNEPDGIYALKDAKIVEEDQDTLQFLETGSSGVTGTQKLQEFCCLAAKCGYRWAWSDTCCINKKNYGELSESINSMFHWYRNSDLTIVYLDDVDDVEEEGRVPIKDKDDGERWFEDPEIESPFASSDPGFSIPKTLSLPNRIRKTDPESDKLPDLQTMRPDTQVEKPYLKAHLSKKFPSVKDWKDKGIYRKLPAWVTRGWTLQEMIASKRLRFYSKQWTLLEEAEIDEADEQGQEFFISSFRFRARLIDHRTNLLWAKALWRTTQVDKDDLINFRVGVRDVRKRLSWAAKRQTTKVEDLAYCLLGIFDISMPVIYGEGPRAFFRLQEELMRRTNDMSIFDWCGRGSSINSFLAYEIGCFVEPALPPPHVEDSDKGPIQIILEIIRILFGAAWTGAKAAYEKFRAIMKDNPKLTETGHTLINGELNLSLFEHQVQKIKNIESVRDPTTRAGYVRYELEVDGLEPTPVTFTSRQSRLEHHTGQYYLCRVWDQHTQNVFHILLELIEYGLSHIWGEIKGSLGIGHGDPDSEAGDNSTGSQANKAADDESNKLYEEKIREELQEKRKRVLEFFTCDFPVFLVRSQDERRFRVSTVNRVVSCYRAFDFTKRVETRLVL